MAERKRFFHWFLEFPEIMERGGFDCILGNPPYLGGTKLSGSFGHAFCELSRWYFAPAGLNDLVVFFLRRLAQAVRPNGFFALITTNSVKDGGLREDGLDYLLAHSWEINMAVRGTRWPGQASLFVSLLSLHNGRFNGAKYLDGKVVTNINAHLESGTVELAPKKLSDSKNRILTGSVILGTGFVVSDTEAEALLKNPTYSEVVLPVLNGAEINTLPTQEPERKIICFWDWPIEKAMAYPEALAFVECRVKPDREKIQPNTAINRHYHFDWWQYGVLVSSLYRALKGLQHCFVVTKTTKYLNFSKVDTRMVFTDLLKVFTTDRWDLYAVVQSTLHEVWARKYSGALETRLRYSPTDCFETFGFPENLWVTVSPELETVGERYHEHRRALMKRLWLGLTDIYNLFHTRDLTPDEVARVSKKPLPEAEAGYQGILELRRLHRELDLAVCDAYGWTDLDLGHDFVEVETLPENDRVRYTISPAARKEVLKRLLAENHRRAALQAQAADAAAPVKKKRGKKAVSNDKNGELF